ncbi:MAG: AAA family ATPase [Akkermansiaceae bacterium]|nr:AAA family ATPase [Armatimonadota bacterium]
MSERPPFLRAVSLDRDKVESFVTHPFSLPASQYLASDSISFHPQVTFFVGENGTGKSTLLEAIAVAWGFPGEGGSKNVRVRTHEIATPLAGALRLEKGAMRADDGFFLRAESFFNYASEIDREAHDTRYYGGRSLHEQSHGEAFFNLFMHRFFGGGLYLLDEPEAALSPMRQMAMLSRLKQLNDSGSQFIIATHSPILMAYPHAKIIQFTEDEVREVAWQETEHYFVTREFLNAPERMLRALL